MAVPQVVLMLTDWRPEAVIPVLELVKCSRPSDLRFLFLLLLQAGGW